MRKTIGIIGGMGPLATVDLFSKIVHFTQAEQDADHLHILIDNDPSIPSRMDAILRGRPNPGPAMCAAAKRLEAAGSDFLIIGCNTAHYYYPAVCAAVNIPVLNLLDLTADAARQKGLQKVGLLATDAILKLRLYEDALVSRGVEVVKPDPAGQKEVMRIIFDGVKAGKPSFDTSGLKRVLASFAAAGAGTAILGCTELPLAFQLYGMAYPHLDPTALLAREAVRQAGGRLAAEAL